MKKSPNASRKLRLDREVVAKLQPRELAHVVGGNAEADGSGPPRCSNDPMPNPQ